MNIGRKIFDKIEGNKWFYGTILFFIFGFFLRLVSNYIWGPYKVTCVDGWVSGSIGVSGACSHHGGVAGDPKAGFLFIISLLLAILFVNYRALRGISKLSLNKSDRDNLSKPVSPYGSKNKHRDILRASGAEEGTIEQILDHYRDD